MHLYIRVEGNADIGLGHIMRCLALAQGCKDIGLPVSFLCSPKSAQFLRSRADFSDTIVTLREFDIHYDETTPQQRSNLQASIEEVRACLSEHAISTPAILVLDGYQFTYQYQQALKRADIKFAYFDDINTFFDASLTHPADIIINGAMSAFQLNYESNAAAAKQCLGQDYLLLRKEFHDLPIVEPKERHHLLVNFGGADSHDYSNHLLVALKKVGFVGDICLLTGAAYQHAEKLDSYIRKELNSTGMSVQHIHDAQRVAPHMLNSRLAVCAAGGTQFELLACATPSILVVVADNQLPASQYAVKQGWCDICEWQLSANADALAQDIVAIWNNEQNITTKFESALKHRQKLHFNGAKNIIDAFKELAQ